MSAVVLVGCPFLDHVGERAWFAPSTLAAYHHMSAEVGPDGLVTVAVSDNLGTIADAGAWLRFQGGAVARVDIPVHAGPIARCRVSSDPVPVPIEAPALAIRAVGLHGPVRRFEALGCLDVARARGGVAVLSPRFVGEECRVVARRRGFVSGEAPLDAASGGPLYLGPRALAALHLPLRRRFSGFWTLADPADIFPAGWRVLALDGSTVRGARGLQHLVEAIEAGGRHELLLRQRGGDLETVSWSGPGL